MQDFFETFISGLVFFIYFTFVVGMALGAFIIYRIFLFTCLFSECYDGNFVRRRNLCD